MNPILEKISKATKLITQCTKAFEITKAQALEDGVIDDDEKQELDELQAQIDELDAIVKDHKKVLTANMAEWKGLAGSYTAFKSQLSELQERGDSNAARLADVATEIDRLEKEYFWKDASTNFQAALVEMAPIYEESTRLNDLKIQYETELEDVTSRFEALALGETTDLSEQKQQAVGAHTTMEGAAEQGDFDTAIASLTALRTLLDNLPTPQEEAAAAAERDKVLEQVTKIDSEIGDIEAEMDALEAALASEMETQA